MREPESTSRTRFWPMKRSISCRTCLTRHPRPPARCLLQPSREQRQPRSQSHQPITTRHRAATITTAAAPPHLKAQPRRAEEASPSSESASHTRLSRDRASIMTLVTRVARVPGRVVPADPRPQKVDRRSTLRIMARAEASLGRGQCLQRTITRIEDMGAARRRTDEAAATTDPMNQSPEVGRRPARGMTTRFVAGSGKRGHHKRAST